MKDLTERQQKRLEFIVKHIEQEGRSPSYAEIGKRFGISSTAAHDAVTALVKKGYLDRKEKNLRALTLPKAERERRENISIRLYDREPRTEELEDDVLTEQSCYIPRSMESLGCYAFIVRSESMTGAGIIPGDIAIMARIPYKDGDIILAEGSGDADDTMELRVIRSVPNGAILSPENLEMSERKLGSVKVHGVLVRIERTYGGRL